MKPKNRALAGVGNPMKFSSCLVSVLKRANRTAERAGTRNTAYLRYGTTDPCIDGGIWR